MDMNEFFTCCIPEDEQQRVQTLEPFDEYEVNLLYPEDQGPGFNTIRYLQFLVVAILYRTAEAQVFMKAERTLDQLS